jgi:hypothetical protein
MAKIYSEKNKKNNESLAPKHTTIQFLLDYSNCVKFEKTAFSSYQFFKN